MILRSVLATLHQDEKIPLIYALRGARINKINSTQKLSGRFFAAIFCERRLILRTTLTLHLQTAISTNSGELIYSV